MADIIYSSKKETFLLKEEAEQYIYQHAWDNNYTLTCFNIKYNKKKPQNVQQWDFHYKKEDVKRGQNMQWQSETHMTKCSFELCIQCVFIDDFFKL